MFEVRKILKFSTFNIDLVKENFEWNVPEYFKERPFNT